MTKLREAFADEASYLTHLQHLAELERRERAWHVAPVYQRYRYGAPGTRSWLVHDRIVRSGRARRSRVNPVVRQRHNDAGKASYWRHRDRNLAYKKVHRSEHREEILIREALYYAEHREERRAYNRRYYAGHRKEREDYQRQYNARHRKEVNASSATRHKERMASDPVYAERYRSYKATQQKARRDARNTQKS